MDNIKLDINTLESWLWESACKIRGEVDAPKYKNYGEKEKELLK